MHPAGRSWPGPIGSLMKNSGDTTVARQAPFDISLVSFGHGSPRSETLYPGLITLWRPKKEDIMS